MPVGRRRGSKSRRGKTLLWSALALAALVLAQIGVRLYVVRHAPHAAVATALSRPAILGVEPRPAQLPTTRAVYKYSIIPGGAYDSEELIRALEADPVARSHYRDFRLDEVRTVMAEDKPVYVSYRIGKHIYWTNHSVRLLRGETLLTDGTNLARARCGNRVSTKPMAPVAPKLVEAGLLDTPEFPVPAPASPPAPALTAEIFPPAVPATPSQVAAHGGTALPVDLPYQGAPFMPVAYTGGGQVAPVPVTSNTWSPMQPSPFQPIEVSVAPVPLPGPIYILPQPVSPVIAEVVPITSPPASGSQELPPLPVPPTLGPPTLFPPLSPPPVLPPSTPPVTPPVWPPDSPTPPDTPTPPPGPPDTPTPPGPPDTPTPPGPPDTPEVPPVPEPSTIVLATAALAGLWLLRSKNKITGSMPGIRESPARCAPRPGSLARPQPCGFCAPPFPPRRPPVSCPPPRGKARQSDRRP